MCPDGNKVTGRPELISKDPEIAVRGSSLILLPLPANICSLMLSEICHFLDDDACVGALPGQGGFQWSADQIFRDCSRLHGRPDWHDRGIKIFGLEASLIPFAPFATPHFVMCHRHFLLNFTSRSSRTIAGCLNSARRFRSSPSSRRSRWPRSLPALQAKCVQSSAQRSQSWRPNRHLISCRSPSRQPTSASIQPECGVSSGVSSR